MNWSYKFAYDEMQEMLDNRPWLLVDDEFRSADNASFIGMQNKVIQEWEQAAVNNPNLKSGWERFKETIRGRLFQALNLTTLTTWNGELNPAQGDPDPTQIAKVEQKFPGVSIVSLIGSPHVVSGPPVSPNILGLISKWADSQRWRFGIQKVADADESRPYYKDEFQFEIADIDRYATDKYFANLVLQNLKSCTLLAFRCTTIKLVLLEPFNTGITKKMNLIEPRKPLMRSRPFSERL